MENEFFYAVAGHMGIDLGGLAVLVPLELLDVPEICAILKQMSGIAVPYQM
jgi:hypothetical protein